MGIQSVRIWASRYSEYEVNIRVFSNDFPQCKGLSIKPLVKFSSSLIGPWPPSLLLFLTS